MPQLENPGFQLIPFPRSRMFVIDAAHVAAGKHMIHGLLEFDVTEARGRLRAHRERTGESLSFTAFVLHCVGAAVIQDRLVHGYRDWRVRLVLFDYVDIHTIVEGGREGGQGVEMHGQRKLEQYRSNPMDKMTGERLDVGIKMAELRFNAEYAEVLRRAKESADRRFG